MTNLDFDWDPRGIFKRVRKGSVGEEIAGTTAAAKADRNDRKWMIWVRYIYHRYHFPSDYETLSSYSPHLTFVHSERYAFTCTCVLVFVVYVALTHLILLASILPVRSTR